MNEETVRSEYVVVDNSFGRVDGVLRQGRGRSRAVVVQTHPRMRSDETLVTWPMEDLPGRGIDTFAYNNRYGNSTAGTEVVTVWEDIALDVAAVVAEMRRRGYESVILYGFSAGAPTVAYYQHVAERGNAAFNGGAAISGFTGFFAEGGRERRLPAADGLVMQNGTTGTGWSFLARLDGSIIDEATGRRDPALDPFEPANGYDPETGAASYGDDFLQRYFRAQAVRMNRLVEDAQERLANVRVGHARFLDDELVVVPGIRAEPASVDLRLASSTVEPRPLYPDGAPRIVRSTRRVVPRYARRNHSFRDGGTVHTLTSFLSYRAVRVSQDGYDPDATQADAAGVELLSSNSNSPMNLAGVTVPVLITASTADTQVHVPHAELLFNSAVNAPDRTIAFVEGGEHDMTPATPDAGDPRGVHLDLLADWLRERYL